MFVSLQRWDLEQLADKSLGSIRFTHEGDALVWNERFLFTPDNPRGEEIEPGSIARRIPLGYSQQRSNVFRSPSGRFSLLTKTSLQPDGFYDHTYITDVTIIDNASELRHRVISYGEREGFASHALTDQGILIFSRGEQLTRFDALADENRFIELAKGWRGLLTVSQAPGETTLVGIDPDSSVGAIELTPEGDIARIIATETPWMGYVEDVDWTRRRALLAMLDSTGAGFVSIHKRIGLVDLGSDRYLHGALLDANIRAAILCPGKDEVAVLCHDRSLHWLRADW